MTAHEQETRHWLQYAHRDLASAITLSRAGDASNACYLAQQSAEKAPKAIYVFAQLQYPYVHNLDVLRDGLPAGWAITPHITDLSPLTDWAVEARYPSELPDATAANAQTAIGVAREIYDAVLIALTAHGFVP